MISGSWRWPAARTCIEGAEHDGDARQGDERARRRARNSARRRGIRSDGYIREPRISPVPDAHDEAGAEQERRVVDDDERLAEGYERGVGRAPRVVAQGHDRQHADDADRDERALDDARGHEADREPRVARRRRRG